MHDLYIAQIQPWKRVLDREDRTTPTHQRELHRSYRSGMLSSLRYISRKVGNRMISVRAVNGFTNGRQKQGTSACTHKTRANDTTSSQHWDRRQAGADRPPRRLFFPSRGCLCCRADGHATGYQTYQTDRPTDHERPMDRMNHRMNDRMNDRPNDQPTNE